MKTRAKQVSTGVIGLVLMCSGAVVGYRGESEARALTLRRDQILAERDQRAAEIESELSDPMLANSRRAELESELEKCRSRGRTGIPGHFPYNARLFGYGCGGFLALAGLLCALYAADASDAPGQP